MRTLKKNLIVTGIPRGGTTLTTSLLNSLSNAICLSEPDWHIPWISDSADDKVFVERLIQDFVENRIKVLNKLPILDRRSEDGKSVTNYYVRDPNGKVELAYAVKPVVFPFKDDQFILGMKHNAHYTAVLPQLIDSNFFSIIAVVRNPISTILSWRSLDLPISRGRLPAGERFWTELKNITESNEDLLTIQVKIYDLFCKRYLELKNEIHLLKYEDIILNPSLMEQLTGLKYESNVIEIKSQNRNKVYDFNIVDEIRNSIIKHAPHALLMYGDKALDFT